MTITAEDSFEPTEQINLGQVVEARASSRVGVAHAGSRKTLGIAISNGTYRNAPAFTPVVEHGLRIADGGIEPGRVRVAFGGARASARYAAGAAFGDRLKAAANGAVTPLTDDDDPRLEVGTCIQPSGVTAGSTGPVRTR